METGCEIYYKKRLIFHAKDQPAQCQLVYQQNIEPASNFEDLHHIVIPK